MGIDRPVEFANDLIVEHPGRVIAGFLVVTVLFAGGLGNIETEAGTQQFAQDIPAQEALQDISREFGPTFAPGIGSTQLIQSSDNVLTRKGLLRMLRAQHRLQSTDGLRVSSTSSAASIVAQTIDPTATTPEDQVRVIERSTPTTIAEAVRTAADENPRFTGLLSIDFNRKSATASATIGVVQHQIPAGLSTGAGTSGSSPLTSIQQRSQHVVDTVGGDIRVFGTGIFAAEFSTVIFDSMILVIPAAVIFIVLFLVVAYRDLVDLLLGMFALGMAIVWTFGFMGLAGIPFNQMLIAVPPLLLAVGIDFGIHAVNRYREERARGYDIEPSMRTTGGQLVVAFFIVTGTTVIGFASNFSSALAPIRDFGLVASIGILFTFLIFGVFLPSSKVAIDRLRSRYPIPTFSQTPLGSEGSLLGRVLTGGVTIARYAPVAFLLVILVTAGLSAYYATGVDTSFTQEDFLPPEQSADILYELPEPFRPGEYTVVRDLNFLEEKFASAQDDTVTVYVQGPLRRDQSLEMINRAGSNPPASFVSENRQAEATGIISTIRSTADRNADFRRMVERNDRNDNGIPDKNLGAIYDELFDTAPADAREYLTEDRRRTQIVYTVKSEASQSEITADARDVAHRVRYDATATGNTVVFQAISDLIFQSALVSLLLALGGTVVFLLLIYRILEGWATLGIANAVPILVTVAFIAGSMRAAGISFNAFTATILAITIGLGIDYSVHVTHRFADEFVERGDPVEALARTVQGTGGALTGSMLTTVFGIGVLVLAVFPAIGQFGLLTALSVVYSYLSSLVVLPSVLLLWSKVV